MNKILIFGKQSFVSKSGKQCFIIHYGFRNESTDGLAVDHKFVSGDVFSRVTTNKIYNVVYGDSYGRAVISDLVEDSEAVSL